MLTLIGMVILTAATIGYEAYQAHKTEERIEKAKGEAEVEAKKCGIRATKAALANAALGTTAMRIEKSLLEKKCQSLKLKNSGNYVIPPKDEPIDNKLVFADTRRARPVGNTVQ